MDIKALIEDLKDLQRKLHVFKHALGVLSYDSETAAPRLSDEGRGETMGALSRMSYELLINDRVRDLLEALHERSAELDPQSRREAEEMRREYKNTTCIPSAPAWKIWLRPEGVLPATGTALRSLMT